MTDTSEVARLREAISVGLGWRASDVPMILQEFETALREQIAQDIEAQIPPGADRGFVAGMQDAARIAREGKS